MKRWFRLGIFLALAISLQSVHAQTIYIQRAAPELYVYDFVSSFHPQNEPWARKGKESNECFRMTTLYGWLEDSPGLQIGLRKGGFVWYGRREIEQILPMLRGARDGACSKQEKKGEV